ncbi:piggyBac transposable element-derived protein 4 [Nephila pilipes]|uniref:PiggyBac transposable element-derived protein 4 n=1 Tax=Nephila pilipes TaxID=299642 RepID=A0A8X6N1T7_NEPPI|nr:piggyBac transposable element-derived protein 4 [Nephila pilipes]
MGTIRKNRIQDYWETDSMFGLRVSSENSSRNRFLLLLRALHFSKIPEQNTEPRKDRLYKIRSTVNLFKAGVPEIYYPGQDIRLDEFMVLWRGRLIFIQYIPKKRHKYGIKLNMNTNPHSIVLKFVVYAGILDNFGGNEHVQKVIMNLLEGI